MRKAVLYVDPPYIENKIFDKNSVLNRDNCLGFYRELKSSLEKTGVTLETQDLVKPCETEIIIFSDIPKNHDIINTYPDKAIRVCMLYESEIIKPWNWDKANHKLFDIIFTWNDDLVDNKKYFKFNFTCDVELLKDVKKNVNNKFDLVMFVGNHKLKHSNSLYHYRRNLIQWYENHEDSFKFNFWGAGWNQEILGFCNRYTKKISNLMPFLAYKYKNYEGYAQDKISILKDSKFCFSIENAKNYNGYITEKIFDCFWARCIPVYMGPPNIDKIFPQNCYISYDNFTSPQELHSFLKEMSEETYQTYISAIDSFINSELIIPFSNVHVAEKVAEKVCHFHKGKK